MSKQNREHRYPGLSEGLSNALRGSRGPWILAFWTVWILGFVWDGWIGFPSPIFGGQEWTLSRSRGAVDPNFWWTCASVCAVCYASGLISIILFFISADSTPQEPRSRKLVTAFWVIGISASILALVGKIVAP